MGIITEAIIYSCDVCGDKFFDEGDVFIVDGQLDFAGANFGVEGKDGRVEIVCPTCFLIRMFKDTDKMEVVMDLVDQHEDEEILEDGVADDDWSSLLDSAKEVEGEEVVELEFYEDEEEGEE